jgi:hypothetical protein
MYMSCSIGDAFSYLTKPGKGLFGQGNKLTKTLKDDTKIRRQNNVDCHGPRPIPNVCRPFRPPSFLITDYLYIVRSA